MGPRETLRLVAAASIAPLGGGLLLAPDAAAKVGSPAVAAGDGALGSGAVGSGPLGIRGPAGPDIPAQNPTGSVPITSTGPLTPINLGEDLSCQVTQASTAEFNPTAAAPADCGTFLAFGTGSFGGTEVYGPAFYQHTSTDTPFDFSGQTAASYSPYVEVSQSGGAGTASPDAVTTRVEAGSTGVFVNETDSYVAGDVFFRSDITVQNMSGAAISAIVTRAGACNPAVGEFGAEDVSNDAAACARFANNSPAGPIEEFFPLTAGAHFVEDEASTVWEPDILPASNLPDTCACTTAETNGAGVAIDWDVTVPAGGSATVSALTNLSNSGQMVAFPQAATAAASGVSPTTATLSGTVNPQGVGVTGCSFQYGTTTSYGQTAPCSEAPGTGTSAVPVSATVSGLAPLTTYHYRVVATNTYGTSVGGDQSITTARQTGAPSVLAATGASSGSFSEALAGAVDPNGLTTTAHFQYGLDPKYSGGGPVQYTSSTPDQTVGSDFTNHSTSATVSGLVPNALYHVRLVATNSAGTIDGPDETFTTGKVPAPGAPSIGKTANVTPVSGLVFIKVPRGKTFYGLHAHAVVKGQGFIPLTQVRQVPIGSEIDARRGMLSIALATGKRKHTQTARISGSVFSLGQSRTGVQKGLTTFTLKENAFGGAPSYAACTAKKAGAARAGAGAGARATKLSAKVLQTLKAIDKGGKFRTKGRYSAATVRGTDWWVQDRCDGTLTLVKRGSVSVQNLRTRKTVVVRAGHNFLVLAATAASRKRQK